MFSSRRRSEYIDIGVGETAEGSVKTKKLNVKKYIPAISIVGFVGVACVVLYASLNTGIGRGEQKGIQLKQESLTTGKINTGTNITQVEISNGKLEGIVLKSRRGKDYSAFYRIPYAKPAVGDLRFEPPQEFTGSWTGIRDATKAGGKCVQQSLSPNDTEATGEEDCHYLSIYAPHVFGQLPHESTKKLLPVMVYLVGGAFVKGQASIYGGDYMMDSDVIIVLPETRFGVLGFLSTGDSVVPGNMGFKDQTMALKWVQANIAKFGGDPTKVTIFGNSSGSMSVHLHMVSDLSAGLFHRAISQSGVLISSPNTSVDTKPTNHAVDIGTKLGCSDVENTLELVKCLKSANASALIGAAGKMPNGVVALEPKSEAAFLTDTPLNIMRERKSHSRNIPWVLGVNSDELNVAGAALAYLPASLLQLLNLNWNGITQLLGIEDKDISKKVKKFYFGNDKISNETRLNLTNLIDDRVFVHPTYLAAKLQSEFEKNNVYLYMLSKKPIQSLGSLLEDIYDPPYGVTHADEVQYFFPYLKFPYIDLESEDLKMSERLVDIWATFSDSGIPHTKWDPVKAGDNAKQVNWFQLDEEMKGINFAGERMDFWDSFPVNKLYV